MLVVISSVSAILAGMGIGGGAIFVLLITIFLETGQKEAQFLNLVMFLSVSLTATITNLKNKEIDFDLIKKVLPLTLIGSLLGTFVFKEIDGTSLNKYFIYFLLVIGIYEIISSLINIKKAKNITSNKKGEK